MKTFKDVDSYIADFPKETQTLLRKIRATIRKAAPKATEKISYGMPGYYFNGYLVYFGGFKKHVSFFPASGGIRALFSTQLAKYKGGKGTIQFPIDKPIPFGLITKIVKFRLKENANK